MVILAWYGISELISCLRQDLLGVAHWTIIDVQALGKSSCVQYQGIWAGRSDVLNVQGPQGPSQGIETALKITGSFVCILRRCSGSPWQREGQA